MAKIEIELSEAAMKKLERLAQERHEAIEDYAARLLESALQANTANSDVPGWGLLADEPELADALDSHVREMRSKTRFR